jgi:hypothetical protein
MLHARSRDGIRKGGKISGLGAGAKQKVSIVERKGPGWTGWLDSQGDGDCPIWGPPQSPCKPMGHFGFKPLQVLIESAYVGRFHDDRATAKPEDQII